MDDERDSSDVGGMESGLAAAALLRPVRRRVRWYWAGLAVWFASMFFLLDCQARTGGECRGREWFSVIVLYVSVALLATACWRVARARLSPGLREGLVGELGDEWRRLKGLCVWSCAPFFFPLLEAWLVLPFLWVFG